MSNPSLIQAEAAARAATRDKFIADTAAEERPSPSTKRAARKALKALHGAEAELERIRSLPPTPADCAHYVARGMLHAAKSFALISRQAHEISEKIAEDPDKEFLAYGAALARVAKIHLENFALCRAELAPGDALSQGEDLREITIRHVYPGKTHDK